MEHKLLINGIELQYSIFDADFMRRFHSNLAILKSRTAECEKAENAHDIIINQCQAVFDFFEGLFGHDKTCQIFGNKMNLMHYLKCFEVFVSHVDEQLIKLEAVGEKYAPLHNA